jgi:hypothetical protein
MVWPTTFIKSNTQNVAAIANPGWPPPPAKHRFLPAQRCFRSIFAKIKAADRAEQI